MVGCPFAAVLCQVNLLQSEDASLRCVGTQTLMQVAKVGKNGFTSFTCRTHLAKWDICAQYCYLYIFWYMSFIHFSSYHTIFDSAIWNYVHTCRQESGIWSRVSTWKTNSFRCSWILTQTRVLAVCLEMTSKLQRRSGISMHCSMSLHRREQACLALASHCDGEALGLRRALTCFNPLAASIL